MTVFVNGVLQGGEGNVTFPATQIPSSGANILDDYEEGVWIPTLSDTSNNGTSESQAYSVQVGRYVKIGRTVFIQCALTLTSIGSMTGGDTSHIRGIPFTTSSVTNNIASLMIGRATGLAVTAGYNVIGNLAASETRIFLQVWDATTGVTALSITEVSADGSFRLTGHYEV